MMRWFVRLVPVMLSVLTACTGVAPSSVPVATPPSGAAPGTEFQQLVARAKASDGTVRGPVGNYTPDEIKLLESSFQQRFAPSARAYGSSDSASQRRS